jgi:enamine deaminase RidA (YjgF/YER057c/UK114 family)
MKRLAVLAGVGLMLVTAGQPLSAQERIVPARFQRTYDQFHYAPIVKVGNTLYLSGVVAGDPDPEQQFETLFRTLNAVLQEAGASLADVVEMTTFHVNMRQHIEAFMQVKDRHMLEPYPAWTAIGISELFSRQALVEIKVTAVVND